MLTTLSKSLVILSADEAAEDEPEETEDTDCWRFCSCWASCKICERFNPLEFDPVNKLSKFDEPEDDDDKSDWSWDAKFDDDVSAPILTLIPCFGKANAV